MRGFIEAEPGLAAAIARYPRVKFAVRIDAGAGRFRYETVDIPHPEGSGAVPMEYPPAVGDLISLWSRDENPETRGTFRVVARWWMHSGYGSADFPYGKLAPASGPLLDIIVERAAGPYRDEAPMCGHEGCWALLLFGEWVPRPGYDDEDLEAHDHFVNPDA